VCVNDATSICSVFGCAVGAAPSFFVMYNCGRQGGQVLLLTECYSLLCVMVNATKTRLQPCFIYLKQLFHR
jgi:hypothetical protein